MGCKKLQLVFYKLISIIAAVDSSLSNIVQWEMAADITKMALDNSSNLYVGGKNFIAKLSNTTEVKVQVVTIGPQMNSDQCPCDNVVKVLEIIQDMDVLLVCGSAYNGTCTLHRLSDITDWSCLVSDDHNIDGAILVTHYGQTMHIPHLPAHLDFKSINYANLCRPKDFGQMNPSNKDISNRLHFNEDIANRTEELITKLIVSKNSPSEPTISFQYIFYRNSQYFIKYYIDNNNEPKIFKLRPNENIFIEFKLSFTWENLTYFVIMETDKSRNTKSKLLRLSADFAQLVYVDLLCILNNNSSYILASVTYTQAGVTTQNKYSNTPVLIATFTNTTAVTKDKSVLCIYSIVTFNNLITKELDLQNAKDNETVYLHPLTQKGIPYKFLITNIFPYPVMSKTTTQQRIDTLDIYLLDENTWLHKISIKVLHKREIEFESISNKTNFLQLESTPQHQTLNTHGVIDKNKSLLYVACGRKIRRLSTNYCAQFNTCIQCDRASCSWCSPTKKCLIKNEDSCNASTETNCPFFVENVSPNEVPVGGGTVLTMTGSNFEQLPSNLYVKVCNQTCLDASGENGTITCRLQSCERCQKECDIQINAYDANDDKTNLTLQSGNNVKVIYVSPSITSFWPNIGPVSGGTRLQIYGNHLIAGSSVSIEVTGRSCQDIQRSKTVIECYWSKQTTQNVTCDYLTIKMDSFMHRTNETFCFRQDPIITNVAPAFSLASGGTVMTILGEHFKHIAKPQIYIKVYNVTTLDLLPNQSCTISNVNHIKCLSPSFISTMQSFIGSNSSAEYMLGSISMQVDKISFFPKGLINYKIFRDPEFNFTTYTSQNIDNDIITIEGKYILQKFEKLNINITVNNVNCSPVMVFKNKIACDLQHIRETVLRQENVKFTLEAYINADDNVQNISDRHITSNSSKASISSDSHSVAYWPVYVSIGNFKKLVGQMTVQVVKMPESNTNILTEEILGAIIAGLVLLITAITIIAIVLYRKRKKLKTRTTFGSGENLHLQPLKEILSSIMDQVKSEDVDKLIISLDKVTIGKPLGSGNFGRVYEGAVQLGQSEIKVAIKTLKDPKSHNLNLAAFIQEAIIMKDFNHPNVLGLVGLSEKEPGIPYVILPYMDNGDLLTYVRNKTITLSLHDVIKFGADIASGMAYLSSLKFVHRDLAARNCMLDSTFTVKVADFGLCRDVYEKGYYSSDNKKLLPIRWMAVESIEHGSYTTKSDVWSIGVVLWELLTRGLTPYPGIDGWDIINFLRQRRLARPHFCPPILYKYMKSCWSYKPEQRPSFTSLSYDLYALIGYEQKVQTPIHSLKSKSDLPFSRSQSANQQLVADTSPTESSYTLLESPGTISNIIITMPACYTLVKLCSFPDVSDCQTFHIYDSTDLSYVQVVDNYEPIQMADS